MWSISILVITTYSGSYSKKCLLYSQDSNINLLESNELQENYKSLPIDVLLKYNNDIANKVYYIMHESHYRPSTIVDYEREAFVEEVTNIRITFDNNISASDDVDNFLYV